MCRMLGIKHFDYTKHRELVENFFKLAEIGKVPENSNPGHTDGWGIGYYKNDEAVVRKSGGSVIKEKSDFFETLGKIAYSPVLIIHFRKSAWAGTNSPDNSHPFQYKHILFAHNGTIYDYKNLLKDIKPNDRLQFAALDSEVFFLYIINNISSGIDHAFKKSVSHIMKNNRYSSLTCVFTDGCSLYAFREYTKSPDYYTLYYAKLGNSDIISSEPISEKINWEILRKDKLFCVNL